MAACSFEDNKEWKKQNVCLHGFYQFNRVWECERGVPKFSGNEISPYFLPQECQHLLSVSRKTHVSGTNMFRSLLNLLLCVLSQRH